MKRLHLFVTLWACCTFISVVFSQVAKESLLWVDPEMGGDVHIKSITCEVVGDEIFKIFEIDCFEEGEYYMDGWILVHLTEKGYPELNVSVNGVRSKYTFKPQINNWQGLALTDAKGVVATVELKKGTNRISIIGKGSLIPAVDYIKLSSNISRAGISDSAFREFFEKVENNSLYYPESDYSSRGTAGESYFYILDMPVYYTTLQGIELNVGDTISITTRPTAATGNFFEHVIDLYYSSNPASFSWFSYGGYGYSGYFEGLKNIIIPATGTYFLRIRPLNSNSSGMVDIKYLINSMNLGQLNAIVAGNRLYVGSNYSSPVNFFTCNTTDGVPVMWLEDHTYSAPGRIIAWNKNFQQQSQSNEYDWGVNARIISSLPNTGAVWVSASSSGQTNLKTDVYAGLQKPDSSILNKYHFCMKEDNSFVSGPATIVYNCIAWSVGIKNSYEWAIDTATLSYFNTFYKSHGYIDCYGADTVNAVIALWAYTSSSGVKYYTHASVRKNPVNTDPHGFDWESKLGPGERVMHTRYALWGNIYYAPIDAYGTIDQYYKPDPSRTGKNNFPSPETTFSSSDLNRIASLKDLIPDFVKTGFDTKYITWRDTWRRPEIAFYSDPRKYAESEEYKSLLMYCEEFGKVIWPLIFEKVKQRDFFVVNMLKDLTFAENRYLYDEIMSTVTSNAEAGIPFSSYSVQVDYSKKLLDKEYNNIVQLIREISKEKECSEISISVNNNEIFLNLFSIKNGKAFVKIYNVFGGTELEADYNICKGNQTIVINASNFKKGIYILKIIIGEESISQTISI